MNSKKRKTHCSFQEEWLTNSKYKLWVSKLNNTTAKCNLCSKDIDLSTMGSGALDSHANGKKHSQKMKDRLQGLDCFFSKTADKTKTGVASNVSDVVPIEQPTSSGAVAKKSDGTITSMMLNDNTLNAEILWTLKVVLSHFSFRSCIEVNKLFQVMFPDSDIASQFALGKTKCCYMINYGLYSYFKDNLVRTINSSPFYTLSFDESMNSVMQNCQMDVNIKFWDEMTGMVQTRYFDSQFLNRPNASNLLESIVNAKRGLNDEKLLQLAMDGPTVNWNVLEMLDDKRIEKELNKTLNIGSCSQHIIHGALQTGTTSTKWNIDKLLKAMYWILHDSPARRNIYMTEGETDVFPLRFCPTRWVEDQPVAERALQIWKNMKNVIKYWEGLCKSSRPKNKSYETLVDHYTDPLVPAKLQFFAFIASIFKGYLVTFQTDKPMVPFMCSELEDILNRLIRLVFKREAIELADSIVKKLKKSWLTNKDNHLESNFVDIGAATKELLKNVQTSAEKKRAFKKECKMMVLEILMKFQERSPLTFVVVRAAAALAPKHMVRHSEESAVRFQALADKLYALKHISAATADKAKHQFDELLKSVKFEHKEMFLKFNYVEDRLDTFLGLYLANENQFKDLWYICKLIFTLSHGQSNVERGFSVNKEILQENLKEKSLVAQRIVYDTLKVSNVKLDQFVIKPDLRKSCKLAYQRYRLEQEKSKDCAKEKSKSEKRKIKLEEINALKKQKLSLERTIDSLRDGIEKESLAAEKNQDLSCVAKVNSFFKTIKEKQQTLDELNGIHKKLENEYKQIV